MIHTILPQEALLPQQPLPPTEWLPCCEGWVQVATAADGTQTVQGVCPEGWHVSTMQEWKAVQAAADYSAARVKSAQYWTGSTGTNDTGLSICLLYTSPSPRDS